MSAIRCVVHPDPEDPTGFYVIARMTDANGRAWEFCDKKPIFFLGEHGPLPCEGALGCEVTRRWKDEQGRQRCRVALLWNVEAMGSGETEFEVYAEQLVEEIEPLRMEYFADGAVDAPLILIFGTNERGWAELADAFSALSRGVRSEIEIHALPEIRPINCRLTARVGDWDRGIHEPAVDAEFTCTMTRGRWDNAAFLLAPFVKGLEFVGTKWQDLGIAGGIKLLVSTLRAW
jgi:hypothetical protein